VRLLVRKLTLFHLTVLIASHLFVQQQLLISASIRTAVSHKGGAGLFICHRLVLELRHPYN
jgi:hypothetical protein